MKVRWRGSLVAGAGALLIPFVTVQACGPDFSPDTFVRTNRPDDLRAFAQGHLGILQTGFDSNELAVAYRYLNGGVLSEQEQIQIMPPPTTVVDWSKMTPAQIAAARANEDAAHPVGEWLLARNQFVPAIDPEKASEAGLPDVQGWFEQSHVNCPDAAFRNATVTLQHRVETWGRQSPWVVDWIHAQDAVFSNCDQSQAGLPAVFTGIRPQGTSKAQAVPAAPAGAPALLRADRAYQTAAADFYEDRYDEAQDAFEAIANDRESPWQAWGGYLAARAEIRKAFAKGEATDRWSGDLAGFDINAMQQAQQMLEKLAAHPPAGLTRDTVRSELNFVRVRTEPDKRAAEICAALAGPGSDPHLKQDLDDLNFLLVKNVKLATTPALLEWIHALRPGNADDSLRRWKETQSLPWLVIAMMHADAKAAGMEDLLAAAGKVKPGEPAYDTVAFHRVRILTALGRSDEAQALADSMLKAKSLPESSDRNAFLGERMRLAKTFDEFLRYAPRTVMDASSPGFFDAGLCSAYTDPKQRPRRCIQEEHALEFDEDSADVLNRQMPLARLVEAAQSQTLPAELRKEVAMAAWTRSVLLGDADNAGKLASLLPERLRHAAGTSVGFPAVLAILRNPGLRPVVEAGFSRFLTYDSLDEFRNNWWCGSWQSDGQEQAGDAKTKPEPAAWLSKLERVQGQAEYERLMNVPCAPIYLGQTTIEYAKAHPEDPDVPEALALTVRATHYSCLVWGTSNEQTAGKDNSATSKEAFELLHAKYPRSRGRRGRSTTTERGGGRIGKCRVKARIDFIAQVRSRVRALQLLAHGRFSRDFPCSRSRTEDG